MPGNAVKAPVTMRKCGPVAGTARHQRRLIAPLAQSSLKAEAMFTNRLAWLIAALMVSASVGAMVLRPEAKTADLSAISLETMIPKQFGDWSEEPQRLTQIVNPQTQALLDKLYSQLLSRVYINKDGYRVMLSLAYGSDQRGALQAHKPEVCYPAQGFTLRSTRSSPLATPFGEIPAQRLFTTLGPRQEPVTYWFTVGDKAVQNKLQKRLVDLRYGLTGQIRTACCSASPRSMRTRRAPTRCRTSSSTSCCRPSRLPIANA